MLIRATAAQEQALPRLPVADPQIVVQCLPCHLGQLEPNRPAGLPLANVGTVDGAAVRRHVIDAKGDKVAAAQLAVDGEIEERQITRALLQLQLGSEAPYVPGPQWRLGTGELALVPCWSIPLCT